MPSMPWHTRVTPHPGSTQQEIDDEPDWEGMRVGHHFGYRDGNGRVAGVITEIEAKRADDAKDVKKAWKKSRHIDEKAEKGELVNFRDVLGKQEELNLEDPKHRPIGWRYMLDLTEDWVKNEQEWPANVRQREEEEKKQAEEASKERENSDGSSESDRTDETDQSSDGQSQDGRTQDEKSADDEEDEQDNELTDEEKRFLKSLQSDKHHIEELKPTGGDSTGCKRDVHGDGTTLIDEADQFTPDNWVTRSSDLIRLTGKHPLNAEPSLTKLYDAGFITPNHLHYVRSHGAVPRLLWEFHKIEIEGANNEKLELSMDDLKEKFTSISVSVLIACDNGRRKELNMIKQTSGFNWGPGAVANAYWKGPLLRDVLLAAGIPERFEDEDEKRYYLHLRGADDLESGKYETSIDFRYAMDPDNDIILAYEMNGVPLPPDHGYPVRAVIPGYVGGRCVKWLEKLWVSDQENDSYYHIWDNRVVPSFVEDKSTEIAETMFSHPDTACYEQMLNSVITKPIQGEQLSLTKGQQKYRIEGFAFNGRGDEVQRVEVSLDGGETWLYCMRTYPERPIRHGKKFWTWLFWHIEVDVMDLLKAEGITVRAWNPFKMTQPEKPIWNILGSMNNAWYTVKPEVTKSDKSGPCLLFRHPVEPGTGNGGWMKLSAENRIKAAEQTSSTPDKQFTRDEIEKHNTEQDCWIVVNGKVYDATSVLSWHPGGAGAVMPHAGKVHHETTEEYESIHDGYAHEKLEECIIGKVTDKAAKFLQKTAEKTDEDAKVPPDQALKKHSWTLAKLIRRKSISHDTRMYTFELPKDKPKLGLGTCQHIEFGVHLKNRILNRPYTPTRPYLPYQENANPDSLHDGSGTFDLTVKTYFPDADQPGGAFSNILDILPLNASIEMRGPFGNIIYNGHGEFTIHDSTKTFERVSLILGGTGITPGYQLIARIAHTQDGEDTDKTQLRILDANKSEQDILLRDELESFEKESSSDGQIQLTHVLADPSDEWKGLKGMVNEDIIREYLFPPEKGNLVLLCGPPGLINMAALPALEKWGYKQGRNLFGL